MPTLRIAGGYVEHVVNETLTKFSKRSGFVICRPQRLDGEVTTSGPITCKKCLELDNPMNLLPTEKSGLRCVAEGRAVARTVGTKKLLRIDYITPELELTRRGALVARDFTEGAAPWRDIREVVHARNPLEVTAMCDNARIFEDIGKLTTERYGKLRAVAQPITCMVCVRLTR
jgi:hypothetical protein